MNIVRSVRFGNNYDQDDDHNDDHKGKIAYIRPLNVDKLNSDLVIKNLYFKFLRT